MRLASALTVTGTAIFHAVSTSAAVYPVYGTVAGMYMASGATMYAMQPYTITSLWPPKPAKVRQTRPVQVKRSLPGWLMGTGSQGMSRPYGWRGTSKFPGYGPCGFKWMDRAAQRIRLLAGSP